ncbi:TlyA family RNA methyltransferase [Glycocaulis sp.]|uniref:TlyA family RNA methyltransferase n=1 Tax=Glycocaulis sp. TaxID=1969725 RepID=UPI0025C40AF6|nr:TlyA family RNA methyltransferase [Glycocaulis sp.]MCH8521278.1 TlyA family RNA methyltransferase [Glycocaulis sp.]
MRADLYLVTHGHFDTRARAQAAIHAGRVRVNGEIVRKPSQTIPEGVHIEAEAEHPFVSRAALKLVAALEAFAIDPAGRLCLDVGSSTGGFTQVLLHGGAARIYAVDVGRDQLHESLRSDPRLTSLEATDARALTRAEISESPSLIVCDASFISLAKLLSVPLSLAADNADLIALYKPQFEVGRDHIGKGGIVRPDAPVQEALDAFTHWLGGQGWQVVDTMPSPVTGADGNLEYLVHARKRSR